MVLLDARAELSEALTELIDGKLSNDAFDDVYYRLCVGSPDRAVEEIGQFGWALYSSDLLWPYYLTGRHAVSAERRRIAERCNLFLRTNLKYEWPPEPRLGWVDPVQMIVAAVGCLVPLFATLLVFISLSERAWIVAGVTTTIGVLILFTAVWTYRWLGLFIERRLAEFWSCGQKEFWPFISEADYELICS